MCTHLSAVHQPYCLQPDIRPPQRHSQPKGAQARCVSAVHCVGVASTGCPSPSPEPSSVRLDTRPPPETYYAHGTSDFLNVAFYSLVWIIIHAMLQEYIWEVRPGLTSPSVCCEVTGFVSLPQLTQRTVKRLHLSKTKTSKYFDSGCLAVFYLVSVVWGLDIIIKSGYATDPTQLWVGYPHDLMR